MRARNVHDIYTEYYLNQAGSGFSNVYAGPAYQRGYGVGSFLGGLFRSLYPLLKKGSVALGSELLKAGASCISDMSHNGDPQEVFKKRGKETVQNLSKRVADHMFGKGYKNTVIGLKRSQSAKAAKGVKKRKVTPKKQSKKKPKKNPKKKVKPRKRSKSDLPDIFS